ncbi:hypothetical protein FGO68_gene1267 [Halteria grandinella]|uniref:Uncharacterized protein n=1 Tax=Halteria grandinella TaxID=5974 RepID=A0A8J8P0F5_HALGN|nr:hypothetical protein FGO68_gene1267 [Halteria grandinella]
MVEILASTNDELTEMKNKNSEATAKNSLLEKLNKEANKQIIMFKTSNEQSSELIETMKLTIDEKENQNQQLASNLSHFQQQCQDLTLLNAKQTKEQEQLKQQLLLEKKNSQNLTKRIEEQQYAIDNLIRQCETLQQEKNQLQSEIERNLQLILEQPPLQVPQDQSMALSKDLEVVDFDSLRPQEKMNYTMKTICHDLIKPPPTQQEATFTVQQVSQNRNHYFLQELMKDRGAQYYVTKDKTKSCFNSLTSLTSRHTNLACFSCHIPNSQQLFQTLQQKPAARARFEHDFKDSVSKSCGKSIDDIAIVKSYLGNNDLVVNYVLADVQKSQNDVIGQIMHQSKQALEAQLQKKLSLIPANMFSVFSLEEGDFDSEFDIKFEGLKLERGRHSGSTKWPYYQPPKGMFRVALNVKDKVFQEDDKIWIESDAKGKEWAVGFHGIRHVDAQGIIGKIAKGGFKQGSAQAYQGDVDLGPNAATLGSHCGDGIYLAPKVEICMGQNFANMCYTRPIEYKGKNYIVLFQCRIKPDRIRVPQGTKGEYYIINNPAHVRPYGLVFKEISKAEANEFIRKL